MATARQRPAASRAPADVFAWLHRPGRLGLTRRRRHVLVLGLLIALGCARALFWSAATPVWSPVDEMAHFAYVQSLADVDGVPVMGRDLVSEDVIGAAKASPTSTYREEPVAPTRADANWGPARQQYEASAAPIYYALMIVPDRLGRAFGLAGEILAVRLATALLGLLVIPLTWALARRMFPRSPPVWLIGPGLLVATNSFAFASTSNDALAVILGAAAVLALLRALDDRPAAGWVVGAGAVLGLGITAKATTVVIAPVLLAVVLTWWRSQRPGPRVEARAAGSYLLAASLAVLPWLVWNLRTYGAVSGVRQVNEIIPPATTVFSLSRVVADVGTARLGLWSSQLLLDDGYAIAWLVIATALPVLAIAIAVRRGCRSDAFGLGVAVLALPAGFVCSELLNFGPMHGTGAPLGRHLLVAVPFTVIGVAGALATLVSRRWLPVAAGAIMTAGFLLESGAALDLLQRAYEGTVHDEALTPVVDQAWSDRLDQPTAVVVTPTCPVAAFSIGFSGSPPATVAVRTADRQWSVPSEAVSSSQPLYLEPALDGVWYRLPTELGVPFTVEIPAGSAINTSTTERAPELALSPGDGDPVARLYCAAGDARAVAFGRDYAPNHPAGIGRDMLRAAPPALATIVALATLAAATIAATAGVAGRRRPDGRPVRPAKDPVAPTG